MIKILTVQFLRETATLSVVGRFSPQIGPLAITTFGYDAFSLSTKLDSYLLPFWASFAFRLKDIAIAYPKNVSEVVTAS